MYKWGWDQKNKKLEEEEMAKDAELNPQDNTEAAKTIQNAIA